MLNSGDFVSHPIRIGIFDQDNQLVTSESNSEGRIIVPADVIIGGNNR